MTFTNFIFWSIFLPLLFAVYWSAFRSVRWQNGILLAASLLFYGIQNWHYIPVLGYCIVITYSFGLLGFWQFQKGNTAFARLIYVCAEILNVLPLIYFKYFSHVFPIGLSFYVFQSSSYLLDLFHKKAEGQKDFISYALFVSFFPTILSGPIQKSHAMIPQTRQRKTITKQICYHAVILFLFGMFLKMILADRLAIYTAPVFETPQTYPSSALWISAVFYSIQIYADFAGYSCMAIAIASLFGFTLQENFRQPYLAVSITDFWRRWHISLTDWFRQYLYFPLGGNRKGTLIKYRNLLIIFLISGIWHGVKFCGDFPLDQH